MTGPTSEGSVNGSNAYIACSAFETGKENKKNVLKLETGNNGTFSIEGISPEGTINLKPGIPEVLKNNEDVKKYKENIKKIAKRGKENNSREENEER